MAGRNSAPGSDVSGGREPERYDNLALRVGSALVLIPLALAAAYLGGWPFAIFWAIAALAVLWEWTMLVAGRGNHLIIAVAAAAIVVAVFIFERGRPGIAILIIMLGAIAAAIFAPTERRGWVIGGVCYAGAMFIAPVLLSADGHLAFIALTYLFAIVWSTDIFGYFAGRAIGGARLAARISPKKTWAGAIAGAMAGVCAGVIVGKAAGLENLLALGFLALLLTAAAQAGDLLESFIKRHFGAKDASNLIPGHGGVMDRLDGFWAAALAGAMIGVARGGFDSAARGLMLW